MKALDHRRYHGHYPGHWRDAFLEAIQAYRDWKPGQPEPTIEMELHYQTVHVPMSRVFGKLCHCTDVLPGSDFNQLAYYGIEPKRRSYAAAARALLAAMK